MLDVNRYYLSTRGNELIQKAIGGQPITITSFKVGSGTLPETVEEAVELKTLVAEKQSFPISSIDTRNKKTKITSVVRNDTLDTGYHAREAAIYAKETEEEGEFVFAIARIDETFIPPPSATTMFNQAVSVYVVTEDAQVTITKDSDIFQLKEDALTIRDVVDTIFPIGRPYTSVSADDDPNKRFPWMTWEKVQEGLYFMAAGDSYAAGSQYGSSTITLGKENLPSVKLALKIEASGNHQHKSVSGFDEIGFDTTNGGGGAQGDLRRIAYGDNVPWNGYRSAAITGAAGQHNHTGTTENMGQSIPIKNQPRGLAMSVWIRTA